MHEAVCITNNKGVVIYWNKSSEDLYGVKRQEIIGKYLGSFFPNALILKVLKKPRKITNVNNEPSPGKTVILSAVPIFNSKNKLIAVASTDRDITEVISLSKELMQEKKKVEFFESAYKKEIASNYSFSSIIGKSQKIIENIAIAKKVAPTSASVLITGESGTGKEVFAKAIHKASGRTGNFVAINCSAIPENLFESELFGYVGGTFTGSLKEGKIGKFEFANNGTLFLDEIGDLPLHLQPKILRVLQEQSFTKIGGKEEICVDVRIIAATNRELETMVKHGQFRQDLYYRLNVIPIYLPSLKDRGEDIILLSEYLMNKFCQRSNLKIKQLSKEVKDSFKKYSWPGNIRELENVIEYIVNTTKENIIYNEHLPKSFKISKEDEKSNKSLQDRLYEYEKNLLISMMEEYGEDGKGKERIAKELEINLSTLYRKLNKYNLQK